MFKKISAIICAALFATILTNSVFAEENFQEKDRIPVGVRAEPPETRALQREARAKLAIERGEAKEIIKNSLARNLYYTTHPAAYQNPVAFSYVNRTIELTDGSIWEIAPSDILKVASWIPSDFIVITANNSWFSSYDFRLTNQNTKETIQVNLELGPIAPIYGSIYTHWIVAIDYYNNIVYLEDESVWKMSSFDSQIVDQWIVGDVLIIGANDGWLSSFSPNILINVAMINYAAGAASF